MRTLLVVMMVSVAALAMATPPARLGGREAPRATDLLRAETLAEQAKKRLQMPARDGGGWKRGGGGWERAARRTPERGSVTIRVAPAARRRAP
jgi:hypothetical protein